MLWVAGFALQSGFSEVGSVTVAMMILYDNFFFCYC